MSPALFRVDLGSSSRIQVRGGRYRHPVRCVGCLVGGELGDFCGEFFGGEQAFSVQVGQDCHEDYFVGVGVLGDDFVGGLGCGGGVFGGFSCVGVCFLGFGAWFGVEDTFAAGAGWAADAEDGVRAADEDAVDDAVGVAAAHFAYGDASGVGEDS